MLCENCAKVQKNACLYSSVVNFYCKLAFERNFSSFCMQCFHVPVSSQHCRSDHIFKKIYDFNIDSSELSETDLLRFLLVDLEIFDLYCESLLSAGLSQPGRYCEVQYMCFHREIQIQNADVCPIKMLFYISHDTTVSQSYNFHHYPQQEH